jgi:secondary thiamine-phosphate synthase enzyme
MVASREIQVETRGEDDLVDVSERVQALADESGVRDGVAHLFVVGSTAALTTIEFEPGLAQDFPDALERLAPRDAPYRHEERWHDDNGHSHVRASLLGPSLAVPIRAGRLALGTWQQIVLVECDTRSRKRTLIVTILGE